jgi:hypothetical protein
VDKYSLTGITFPSPLTEIRLFEKKNKPNVSIIVYGLKEERR